MDYNIVLSIVIANYNYGRFLEAAIRSVIEQDAFDKCELIIIDGGSTDNSIEVIKKFEDKISYWVSEKDRGQSDAFNKGFARARGQFLTWVNADDLMVPGCVSVILQSISKHRECEWFTANYFRFLESTKEVIELNWGPNIYPKFLQHSNSPIVAGGPSSIFSKKIYEQVGGIDENLYFIMDTDLWLRFMALGIKQRRIRCFCWAFRMHEESKTAEFEGHRYGPSEELKEERRVAGAKVSYRESKLLKGLLCLWRTVDGSYLYRHVLRRQYMHRHMNCIINRQSD